LNLFVFRKSPPDPKQKKRGNPRYGKEEADVKKRLPQNCVACRIHEIYDRYKRCQRYETAKTHPPKIGTDSHLDVCFTYIILAGKNIFGKQNPPDFEACIKPN